MLRTNPRSIGHSSPVRVMAMLAVLVLAGCNAPASATAEPAPTEAPTATVTPRPTKTATQAPTPVPAGLVWFAPNMGSIDYPNLFSNSDAWDEARSRIDVFKFYTQNLLDDPCEICGNNLLGTMLGVDAFRALAAEGIATAIEVGAVKEWGCTSDITFGVTDTVIRNVQENGGRVDFLAMDEPLIGGQIVANGATCGYTMEQTAG